MGDRESCRGALGTGKGQFEKPILEKVFENPMLNQHKAVEPGNGLNRQHAPLRDHKARQYQREKGKGDEQDV